MSISNEAVRKHIEGFWPDRPQEEFSWEWGPIEERVPGFRVRRVAPVKASDPWVYLTVGASSVSSEEGGIEFFLLAPSESPRHVETLAMVASFHADLRYRLGLGRIVNIGRPWADGAVADHLLVSLPYPYGPDLEVCQVGDAQVRILWLVPITASEPRFAFDHGTEELERMFDAAGVDVLIPGRASPVT